jgi:hypothetical protein
MNNKFDELAKGLAYSVTRRQGFNRFGGGLAGMAPVGFAGRSLALFLIAGLLGASGRIQAQGPPSFAFNIPPYSPVPGPYFFPASVAVGSNGVLYVTDQSERVVRFSSQGAYLGQWGSPGSGAGQFDGPAGIAVDGSNNIYVVDTYNNRVQKFTATGAYLGRWGSYGSAAGQFNSPLGIAIDSSNNVYVAENGNNRIQKFTSGGTYLTQWGPAGFVPLFSVAGVSVDHSNNVYVTADRTIQKFASDGTYITEWGGNGPGPGQFRDNISGIAIDGSDNIYATDGNDDRVQKFRSDGTFLTQWATISSAWAVAADSTGNFVYVSDGASVEVFAYTPVGPPIVSANPASQIVPSGVNVTLSAGIFGGPPLTYQWFFNGTNLPGATQLQLLLTNVSPSQSGRYALLVTNNLGWVGTSNALLVVKPSFVFTQPAWVTSPTTAKLNGMVMPGGNGATVWFEWGYDTNYGNTTAPTLVAGNANVVAVNASLSGLSTDQVYHNRLACSNYYGVVYGADQQFTLGMRVVAWGAGTTNNVQAGIPYAGQATVPPGLSNVVAIAAGAYHSLALRNDGTVVGWGDSSAAVVPPGLTNVVAIAGGWESSLILKSDGSIVAWGGDLSVSGLSNIVAVAGGLLLGYALKADGTVVGLGEAAGFGNSFWGNNIVAIAPYNGESFYAILNTGNAAGAHNSAIAGLSNMVAAAYGFFLRNDGIVVLEPGTSGVLPSLRSVVEIASGGYFALALRSDGTIASLGGDNKYGELNVPASLSNAVAIAAGYFHSLALTPRAAPDAFTLAATGISDGIAGLNGTVNPSGFDTTAWFQWGTTTNYGSSTPVSDLGSGFANLSLSNLVSGLTLNAVYHYRVVASNALGTSYGADLSFTMSAPVVTMQPQSHILFPGGTATFSVTAGGIGPFAYQWMLDGTNIIAGATNSTYALPNAQLTDQGAYSCMITDPLGSVTSAPAQLSIVPVPDKSYVVMVLEDNPIAYWRLGETNGAIAYDFWGGHDGQYTNVILGVPGSNPSDPDTAVQVGPSSNSFVANIQGIDFSASWIPSFSVECWVDGSPSPLPYPLNYTYQPGIVTKGTGTDEQFDLDVFGSGYRWFVRDAIGGGSGAAQASVGPNNTWQHLVGVYDGPGKQERLYVNGALVGSAPVTGNGVLSTPHAVTIGSRQSKPFGGPYDFNFNGRIDEVAIYDHVLSTSRIVLHYAANTAQAVARLTADVSAAVPRDQPLVATLNAALASIQRGDAVAVINQLLAFQNKVRAQVAPLDSALADTFINDAQTIIVALADVNAPAELPHGLIAGLTHGLNERARLQFTGQAGRVFLIEASSNLMDWELIGAASERDNGSFELEDPTAPNFVARFYRVVTASTLVQQGFVTGFSGVDQEGAAGKPAQEMKTRTRSMGTGEE